jgi:putative transposase
MARSFAFAPGEFYHVYNRGTEKRNIFSSRADHDRFLTLLYLCNQTAVVHLQIQGRTLKELSDKREGEPLVAIVAYCLMPNHFHLLVHELQEGGLSKFMQKVMTGYTMYFNKKNDRNGSLFQGKFKATHVTDDRYLRYLVSYIHLNPVKLIEPKWKENSIADRAAAEQYLAQYGPSSYRDYLGEIRPENAILSPDVLPEYFDSGMKFKELVTEWLTYAPN